MDLRVRYLGTSADPTVTLSQTMTMRMIDEGFYLLTKQNWEAYAWEDVKRISFDDPGRTRASVGMIMAFGALGLAKRKTFTLVTVSITTEELYFEIAEPIGLWRAKGRGVVEACPAAKGRVYVDGVLAGEQPSPAAAGAAGQSALTTAGWHADPLGIPQLRWHDGASWTDKTHPLPAGPE